MYNFDFDIVIEYKLNELWVFFFMLDIGMILFVCKEVNVGNFGVMFDFVYVLYVDEMLVCLVVLIVCYFWMIGLYLNDGYGKCDDGLMVGFVYVI